MIVDSNFNRTDCFEKKIIILGDVKQNVEIYNDSCFDDMPMECVDINVDEQRKDYNDLLISKSDDFQDSYVVSCLDPEIVDIICEYNGIGKYGFYTPNDNRNLCVLSETNREVLKGKKNYIYIHFINDDKFLVPFYNMINDKMDINEHFFVMNKSSFNDAFGTYSLANSVKNILVTGNGFDNCVENVLSREIINSPSFWEIIENSKKILLHSGFLSSMVKNVTDVYGGKTEWISWGGDQFFGKDSVFVNNILPKIRHGWVSGEKTIQEISNRYNIKCKNTTVKYTYVDETIDICNKSDNTMRILVGHSGDVISNTLYGLEILEKYRNENIEIYAPLTYGDSDYIEAVVYIGYKIYGEKFVPITEHIEPNKYYELLSYINVALLPALRIRGATTATYLTSIGRDVYYLPKLKSLGEEKGLKMLDIEDIRKMSFEDFCQKHQINSCDKTNIINLNKIIVEEWNRILNE